MKPATSANTSVPGSSRAVVGGDCSSSRITTRGTYGVTSRAVWVAGTARILPARAGGRKRQACRSTRPVSYA